MSLGDKIIAVNGASLNELGVTTHQDLADTIKKVHSAGAGAGAGAGAYGSGGGDASAAAAGVRNKVACTMCFPSEHDC